MAEKNSWSTKTYQSGIKGSEADGTGLGRGVVSADQITKYALFQGGLNATHDSLTQYDPFKTGFGRIFMVRQPQIMADFNGGNDIRILKHLIEYANTGISGFGNIELKTSDMQGGYSNRSIKIPTISDDTNIQDFTIEIRRTRRRRVYLFRRGRPRQRVRKQTLQSARLFQRLYGKQRHARGYENRSKVMDGRTVFHSSE